MARDISIAISARDNFTQAITTIRNANQAFNKDLTGLQNKLDALNKNKIVLKVETEKARMALKEAEKQFMATGSAADKMNLELANAKYETARRNLDLVSKSARQAEKDILNLTSAASKAENKTGNGTKSLLSSLAAAGALKVLGDTAANITAGVVGSAFGEEGSTMLSNILSGAASGAAVGSIIPALGPAVGAVAGAGLGVVNGLVGLYTAQDEAFKGVVQESYNKAKQEQADTLTSGSAIAANREQKQISFSTLLGSDEAAKDYLAQMTEFASKTPFQYDQLAEMSKTLLAYGYKVDELLPLLTKIGDTGSALGMTAEDMNFVATSLGRMQTTGKTTLEYLNPLLERGIPVWDYLAKASGKTKAEVQEMVSKGLVPGAEAAKAIADYMGRDFAGNMEKQSQTFQGLVSTLQDAQDAMAAAMGEGYNEERKKGIQAQIDWLSGESGEKMKEANKMIGEWKASLENEREAAIRKAINDMMASEEYKQAAAEGNRVKMGELLAEAQVKGENEYKASKGYQLQLQEDLDLVQRIREDTALKNEYWNTGYIMGREFSKGRMAGINYTEGLEPSDLGTGMGTGFDWRARKHAYGLNYVPYDDFPVLLHQGERILTASEARAINNGANITITGNSFVVREEADIEKIAREICKQIKMAAILTV
jgi:tape measure domain-containing protein